MNRDRAKELVDKQDIIKAIAEGKTIQHRPCIGGATIWKDIDDPTLNAPAKAYRIKPEPREFWIHKDLDQILGMQEDFPDWEPRPIDSYIKVREVIE